MPKIGTHFSESSYAFGFVDNLIHSGMLDESDAPVFLSTYTEGRGAHWDVHLPARPVAFFFQFKIPKVLQRGSLLSDGSRLHLPFYRMDLRAENDYRQHHGLLELESAGENVYYTSPRFHEDDQFRKLYSRQEIPQYSVWFRPSGVSPTSYDERHGVAYDYTGTSWEIRSKRPVIGEGPIDLESFLQDWQQSIEKAPKITEEVFVSMLSRKIESALEAAQEAERVAEWNRLQDSKDVGIFEKLVDMIDPYGRLDIPNIHPLLDVASRARSALGLEVLIGGRDS